MLSRRNVLKGLAAFAAGTVGLTGYAFGVEPWGQSVTRYRLTPPGWPTGLRLRIVALSDIHACDPWMSVARIEGLVAQANMLGGDITLLLGDYVGSMRFASRGIPPHEWAAPLSRLKAPLGVHAVVGNHEWWDDKAAQRSGIGPTEGQRALEAVGIPVYINRAVKLAKDGRPFWLAGLDSQWALLRRGNTRSGYRRLGVDDLPGTMAQITDDAPVLLMAHEPDIFPTVPGRVSLTLSGHTHGGQVTLAGYAPLIPSRYGNRYRYGHIVEDNRHLIVTSGLGCSSLPIRFAAPPEILSVELGGPDVGA